MTSGLGPSRVRIEVERLSDLSVRRRWEPFEEIGWEAAENQIDPTGSCWELPDWDPLGASGWYQAFDADDRARIGLARVVGLLQTGIDFESVLQQGLLSWAAALDPSDPARRYAYHEVIEEAKHSMMFSEFIRRSGLRPSTDPAAETRYRAVASMSRDRLVLFLISSLAGETAFDLIQLRSLRDWDPHPLLRTINRVHRAEEARHLAFAEAMIRDRFGALDRRARRELALQAPVAARWTAEQMMCIPEWIRASWEMPEEDHAAICASEPYRALLRQCLVPVEGLARSIGLASDATERLWIT